MHPQGRKRRAEEIRNSKAGLWYPSYIFSYILQSCKKRGGVPKLVRRMRAHPVELRATVPKNRRRREFTALGAQLLLGIMPYAAIVSTRGTAADVLVRVR